MNKKKSSTNQCASCGSKLEGKYCSTCGEKVLEPHELSTRYVLGNLLNAFTFLDSKLLKTFTIFFVQPGRLSLDWVQGRRVKWMRPISFFFMLNFIYFLFPMFQTFNTSYHYQVKGQNYSRWVAPMAEAKRQNMQLSEYDFEQLYNTHSSTHAKLLIVVFVLVQSWALLLVFAFSRRYYAEHLVFAFEWSSFNLMVNTILLWALSMCIGQISNWFDLNLHYWMNDSVYSFISVSTNMIYLFFAANLFYKLTGIRLILFTLLGVIILFISLLVFRLVLFMFTLSYL